MSPLGILNGLALALYYGAVLVLFLYGINCYVLLYLRGRAAARALADDEATWQAWAANPGPRPMVTVQLPIYNERYVVGRLLEAVSRLDYPRDRLEIQVLDDSTDETTDIAAALVEHYRRKGFAISLLHRQDRTGYKAGALRAGLAVARGEFVAIFDADFVPGPDFLARTLPFFHDPGLAVVQVRWGHVNPDYSLLTRAQALMMDGHFWVEQPARGWSRLFLTFNGSAGVWRRAAIEDAGGWETDTLTEDLDLSYRAQLKGWRIKFLPQVTCPAELPVQMSAFKAQQHRWAKGSIQTAKKLLPRVLEADLPLLTKIEALFHLGAYLVQPCMLLVALAAPLLPWMGPTGERPVPVSVLFSLAALGPLGLFLCTQRALYRDWKRRLVCFPTILVFGTGMALNTTKAVLEALFNVGGAFVRTPKFRIERTTDTWVGKRYRIPFGWLSMAEAILALYFACGILLFIARGSGVDPFLALCAVGFGTVALLGLWESLGVLLFARERGPHRRHGARGENAAVVGGSA